MLCMNIDRMYQLQGGMTDTAFAKKLGISRSQLWRVRTGKSSAGPEFLTKFKSAFPTESIDDYFFSKECSIKGTVSANGTQ